MKERRKGAAGSLPAKVRRQCFGDSGNLTTKFSVERKSKRQKMDMIYGGSSFGNGQTWLAALELAAH
ncbi:unnamed protein product [Linum trigynum]|uniref:Uncharacterized protein n=1 Tax=Linum trigynum TaxID=586398 RepID=A0AAV2DB23_9ROSI